MIRGLIFDLDGVICDTAKYHYLAWKQLALQLGIVFTPEDNEKFKGVSRMRCMEILLEMGGLTMDQAEMERLCTQKNEVYVAFVRQMGREELLPGVENFLEDARAQGYGVALGSASKNSVMILHQLGIFHLFDAVVDGTRCTKAKPDPEVFLLGAQEMGLQPHQCIVFEDAVAGIQAANAAGMKAVGIGKPSVLRDANIVMKDFEGRSLQLILGQLK